MTDVKVEELQEFLAEQINVLTDLKKDLQELNKITEQMAKDLSDE